MRKFYILGLVALAATILVLAWAEQISLTTFYSSPSGASYQELTTTEGTLLATDAASNVGIGTNNPDPTYKLDVRGSQRISGNLTVSGTMTTSQICLGGVCRTTWP